MARNDCVCGAATEGRLARQHLVEDAPKAVDVGPAIEIAIRHALFGAHVVRSAERDAGLRQLLLARGGCRPGDPEIHHQGMPVIDQDVLGLDVAVYDALLVRVLERIGCFGREEHGIVDAEWSRAVEARAQRLAGDERHDVVQLPVEFPGVVQRQDPRMAEARRHGDLAQKALGSERHADVGEQHLDRDIAGVALVAGEVDRGHAPAADLTGDEVAAVEQDVQQLPDRVSHE